MKRIVSKGYTCKLCSTGIRITKPNSYVRCQCGALSLYGDPTDPVVTMAYKDIGVREIDTILMVPDDYKSGEKGGIIVLSHQAASCYGMPKAVLDMVMPLVSIGHSMGWSHHTLIEAAKALIDYDKMIHNTVR